MESLSLGASPRHSIPHSNLTNVWCTCVNLYFLRFQGLLCSSPVHFIFLLITECTKMGCLPTKRCSIPAGQVEPIQCKDNRLIVLLGSGLETGHPDRAADLFIHFAMLKTVKLADRSSFATSPVLLSRLPAGIFLFLTVLGFFN